MRAHGIRDVSIGITQVFRGYEITLPRMAGGSNKDIAKSPFLLGCGKSESRQGAAQSFCKQGDYDSYLHVLY